MLQRLDIGRFTQYQLRLAPYALVVGTIESVQRGDVRTLRTEALACETADGNRSTGVCEQRQDYQMLRIDVRPRRVRGPLATSALDGRIDFEITLGQVNGGADERAQVEAVVKRIVSAGAKDARVAAYVFYGPSGFLQLIHPDAWAIVSAEGRLLPLNVSGVSSDESLLGATNVSELPAYSL